MIKIRYFKLSKSQIDRLIKAFVLEIPALLAAEFARIHRNTARKFFTKIRLRIAKKTIRSVEKLSGEQEIPYELQRNFQEKLSLIPLKKSSGDLIIAKILI